jgi:O-antigen/teichoic acid export membrane protein
LSRYLRHVASFAGRQAVGMVVNFALTAFLLRRLGAEGYGVWAIALSLGSYLGLVDLNTNASVVKYTAELSAQGKRQELAPMVNAGVQILFSFSFGLLALALALLPWLTPLLFKTQAYAPAELSLLAGLCLLSFALLQTGNVYQQVMQGLLHQDEVNAIGAAGVVINALAAGAAVAAGRGVVWLGLANLSSTLAVLLLTRLRVAQLAPEIPWIPWRSTAEWRRRLLRFSGGAYAFTLWGWFYFMVPKMLLANQLGPVAVGFYDIATKLGHVGRNLVQTLSGYLIPFLSEAGARDGEAKVHRLQTQALTVIWMVGLGVGGFFLALRDPLLTVWLKRPDLELRTAVLWVVLELSFGGLAMPWVHFALAEARLRHARPFLAYIIPACVLGPWLGLRWGGFTGFLIGGFAVNALGTLLFYILAVRERGLEAGPLAADLGKVSLGWALGWVLLSHLPWSPSLPALILAGVCWLATLAASWGILGLWTRDHIGQLVQRLRPGRAA